MLLGACALYLWSSTQKYSNVVLPLATFRNHVDVSALALNHNPACTFGWLDHHQPMRREQRVQILQQFMSGWCDAVGKWSWRRLSAKAKDHHQRVGGNVERNSIAWVTGIGVRYAHGIFWHHLRLDSWTIFCSWWHFSNRAPLSIPNTWQGSAIEHGLCVSVNWYTQAICSMILGQHIYT